MPHPSPREDIFDIFESAEIHWHISKNILQNHWANFNHTWQKSSLFEGSQCSSNVRPTQIDKFKNLPLQKLSRPILTINNTKHPCVKFIQINGPALIQGKMITKYQKFKNLLCYQFQLNLAKSIPGLRGFTFVQMERPHLFTMEDNNKIARIHSQN